MKNTTDLKILVIDIETKPLKVWCWGLFDQNIGINQIDEDFSIIAFSAKWYKDANGKVFGPHDNMIYEDLRNAKDKTKDKNLLKKMWKLLDEADIVLGQNSIRFDTKKISSRFLFNDIPPPSSFRHIDTLQIDKKYFAHTSNKLEYIADKICKKHKKMVKRKFAGFDLWKECLADNVEAWDEMKIYNGQDVLATEELYHKLSPWDTSIDFNLYSDDLVTTCKCGSNDFTSKGYYYTAVGKFKRDKCKKCGAETRGRKNLLSKEKKETIKTGTSRNSS